MQDRIGMFNKPSEKINLNSPDPNSDIYISEGERFNKDFAAYDYNRRNIEHERKKEMYQNRKNQLYERERKRWEKMDYEYLRAENKIMMNKERNIVGRKNNPGMAFNPLTLQYDNSVQGEILKRRDDESKFRALMRATNIDKHANAGYNIINGEERTIMENRMLKEIEPSVYKKNIDKINEINQRHNDNDNFYTKGPSYNQPRNQFQQIQEINEKEYTNNEKINKNINNNEYYQSQKQREDYNNQNQNNLKGINQNNIENRQIMANESQFNDIHERATQKDKYNNICDNDNNRVSSIEKEYQRMTPNNNCSQKKSNNNKFGDNYYNYPVDDNYQRKTPQVNNNYNNIPPNDDYQRMTPQNNNYNDIPPNNNNQKMTPQNNNIRTSYSENNYRRMTPSNHGFNQMQQNEEYQQIIPDHYSEQDKHDRRFQTMNNDFDRQYNYMGNQEQNNYEDFKNQEYYSGKQGENDYYSQNYIQRDERNNLIRDPYARPDYYANNRPRTMG